MSKIPRQAYDMLGKGADVRALVQAKIPTARGQPVSQRQAERWRRTFLAGQTEIVDTVKVGGGSTADVLKVASLLKDKKCSLRDLSVKLDRSEQSIENILEEMESQGYNLIREKQTLTLSTAAPHLPVETIDRPLVSDMKFSYASPSDLHCGSKEEQITHRNHFIRSAREMGVTTFFVPGDLTTGLNMYRGHQLDVYAHTAEAQEEALARAIVPLPDENWYILGGNHDFSWIKNGMGDLVWRFCQRYENVHYLGYDEEDIPLTDKVSVRLWHPTGGLPYATSYRLQKGMETLAFEELLKKVDDPHVKIMIAGHLHVALELPQGGIVGFQAGCFEGRTSLLKRLGKFPRIGGYICTFYWDDAGNIDRYDSSWLQYTEIKNDYLNYPLPVEQHEAERIEYIYSLA